MGRPSKLTPERQKRIVDAIRAGNYVETAAEYAGIGKTTFYRWMEQGEQASHGIYREFRDAVMRARAEAEARSVALIQKAAPDDWRAAAWWLERAFPDRWGPRQKLEHSGPEGGPIPAEVRVTLVRPNGEQETEEDDTNDCA